MSVISQLRALYVIKVEEQLWVSLLDLKYSAPRQYFDLPQLDEEEDKVAPIGYYVEQEEVALPD